MNTLILNEKKYIENIINNKYYIVENKPAPILKLIAQYYYEIEGYRRKKITELLIIFLSKHYPRYAESKQKWDNICADIAKRTGGNTLMQSDGIIVTGSELKTIIKILDRRLERLTFTLLVVAKYFNAKNPNNNNWVNLKTADLFKMARVAATEKEQEQMICQLVQSGLLKWAKKINNDNLQVTFISDDEPTKTITDMRELGYQYDKSFYSTDFWNCEKCGILIRKYGKQNNKHLCKDCYEKSKYRKALCTDCGNVFVTSKRAAIKKRCDSCQKAANQRKKKEWQENKKKSDRNYQ